MLPLVANFGWDIFGMARTVKTVLKTCTLFYAKTIGEAGT
jgi:hypothetical protein